MHYQRDRSTGDPLVVERIATTQPTSPAERRTCRVCGVEKPQSEFYQREAGRLRTECRDCWRAKARQWANANPDQKKAQGWRKHLRSYGLTPENYDELLATQDNRCAICRRENPHPQRRMATDHCHATGMVRGVLCTKCNAMLGWVEIVGLDVVREYLSSIPLPILEGFDGQIEGGHAAQPATEPRPEGEGAPR